MGTLRKKIESDPAHPRYIQTHVASVTAWSPKGRTRPPSHYELR